MVASNRQRLIPLWAGAAFALLLGGLVAPEQAWAGCSHYVVSQADRLDLSLPSHLDLPVSPAAPIAPPDHRSPCAGLSCSSDPVAPPIPSPVPTRASEWGCLASLSQANRPDPFLRLADFGRVRPILHALPIDRPPRVSS